LLDSAESDTSLRALLKAWLGDLEEIVEEVVVRAVAVGEKG